MRDIMEFTESKNIFRTFESKFDTSWWHSGEEPEVKSTYRELPRPMKLALVSEFYYECALIAKIPKTIEQVRDSYLDQFLDAVNNARYVLDLGDDWDEVGSKGYKQDTLDKACKCLLKFVDLVHKRYSIEFEVPKVLPGPNGGIDIHWKTSKYELLIEIPEEGDYARYFGDNIEGEETKGKMRIGKPRINHGLLLWLTQ